MALADEDRQHAEALLYDYRRRLRVRERQASRLGDSADPSIGLDADDLRRNITMLEAVLKPELPDAVTGLIKLRLEDEVFLFQQSVEQNARITKVEGQVATIATEQHSAGLWRLNYGDIIDALQARAAREDKEAPQGRRRNFKLLVASIVLLAIVFGIQLWMVFR